MTENTKVRVTNRSTGVVYYTIPEMNIRREFQPKESKTITVGEIASVCSQDGGRELFYNYLLVQDENVITEALNVNAEPEYWLTEVQIPTWINSCTVDEFSDALNFAPVGVKDLIKKYAVSEPLTDMNKRLLVKNILGFDITGAIAANDADKKEEAEISGNSTQIGTPKRKSAPNYKIVGPKKA